MFLNKISEVILVIYSIYVTKYQKENIVHLKNLMRAIIPKDKYKEASKLKVEKVF